MWAVHPAAPDALRGTVTAEAGRKVGVGAARLTHPATTRRRAAAAATIPEGDRHQEFGAFLGQVAAAYPRRELHVVVDNYATHNHPAVRVWLQRLSRAPALHADLGVLAESGRGVLLIITRRALRHGNFPTVADLIAAIERFIAAWNDRCTPFTWTKDPDTVIAKAIHPRNRKTEQTSDTNH